MSTLQTVRIVVAFQESPKTPKQISKLTGMEAGYIRQIVGKLIGAGYLEFDSFVEVPKGPKPSAYRWKK